MSALLLLADKVLDVSKQAREVKIEHDNFLQLAEFMDKVIPIAQKLQDEAEKYDHIREAVEKDVDNAYELVKLCTSKSQMYLLTHCRSVVRQLEDVTHDLGKNLEALASEADASLKTSVSSLSKEMQEVQFQVQASEERICRALERETSTIRSDLAVQTGILMDIARTVGVEDFTKNPHALRNQIELLRNDIQGPHDLQVVHLIGNMFDNFLRRQGKDSSSGSGRRKKLEDPYDTFLCPLTKEVMVDPVTIAETGKTYERSAINAWFAQCKKNGNPVTCPLTKKVLDSTELKASIALRSTIEEWHARNDNARMENTVTLLQGNSSDEDILDALDDLQLLCRQNKFNKSKIVNVGLIPRIVDCLKNGEDVRCKVLETLRLLAENDDDVKVAIGETTAIYSAVKCLSRELSRERGEAVLLLLELSKYAPLCESIGESNGAILILVGMTSSKSENIESAEKAEETLDNLERCDANVRQMAENGRLKPLVTRLLQDSQEMRVQMASYIADIPINNEGKAYLAEAGAGILIQMLDNSQPMVREVALKSLRALSTLESNGRTLIQAGVLQPITRDLFMAGIGQIPAKLKEVAATVLANVINPSSGWEEISIDEEGNTLTSEQYVHNLLLLISNTGPAIETKLLQVLHGLACSSTGAQVAAHIRSFGAVVSLIQFLEAPQRELLVASVKLLFALSDCMAQELADGLRVTTRQLATLVRLLKQPGAPSEEMADAAGLLANLPVDDFGLTRSLLEQGLPDTLATRLRGGASAASGGRFAPAFRQSLVAILARFTFDLDDPELLQLAEEGQLCALFTSVLAAPPPAGGGAAAQRWAAAALENLSTRSRQLAAAGAPEEAAPRPAGWLACCFGSPPAALPQGMCSVHGGICSANHTFCLIEAGALELLVACLEQQIQQQQRQNRQRQRKQQAHRGERQQEQQQEQQQQQQAQHQKDEQQVEVMAAVLQALSTLIQEPCDVERGVRALSEAGAVGAVVAVLREQRSEALRERAVWIVERMLRNGDVAPSVAASPDVYSALVDAFRHGSYRSRQLAERSLKHLNKIPNFSGVFPSAGSSQKKA